jgi:hypothetical protein
VKIVARCTAREQGTVTLIPEVADPDTAPARTITLTDCAPELEALCKLDGVMLLTIQPMHL